MKQEFKPFTWSVKKYLTNDNKILDYDVLKYREDYIKKLKKKCHTKEEFAEKMRIEMMCQYWSRCEYEVIISIDDNNHVWLSPWVGCKNPESVKIDVTDDESFNWRDFAEHHIKNQIYKNEAKIDIYDQLQWRWSDFIDYCWNYRHKWQRKNDKE